jgi:hypothetical protein
VKDGPCMRWSPGGRQGVLITGARDHTAYPKKDVGQLEFDLFGPGAVEWEAA